VSQEEGGEHSSFLREDGGEEKGKDFRAGGNYIHIQSLQEVRLGKGKAACRIPQLKLDVVRVRCVQGGDCCERVSRRKKQHGEGVDKRRKNETLPKTTTVKKKKVTGEKKLESFGQTKAK